MIYPSACQYNHEYTLSIQKDFIKQKWIHTIEYEFSNNLHCFNVMINKNCIRRSKIWYKMELFLLNKVSSMLHDIIWYVLPIFFQCIVLSWETMLPTTGDKEKYSHLGTFSPSPRNPDFLNRILTKLGLSKYDRET